MLLEFRSEDDRAARLIRVGDSVRYFSGRGIPYIATVVSIPKEGQNDRFPPTLELEFRDERGKLQRRARALHKLASGSRRMIWEAILL